MIISRVKESGFLSDEELHEVVASAFAKRDVHANRVLCIIPDSTRSMPMPSMFRALHQVLSDRVARLDYLIALGTHPPMAQDAINTMLGITEEKRRTTYRNTSVYNHEWDNPDALASIGTISGDEIADISGGLLRETVKVTVNKRLFDYDLVCIVGPVFPHEAVGMSGGNKYFFPGVAGADIINLFHWLAALIADALSGTKYTPVRQLLDRAASFIQVPKFCFSLNVVGKQCKGIFAGPVEEAWVAAADLVAKTHIVYKDHPYASVLAMAPEIYDQIWGGGKCMYKLESVVADGGELIIYGPHIKEISVTHGHLIKKIGYHTRDYFLAQVDKFSDIPRVVLAHCMRVRGIGTYRNGVEAPRVQVTLATAIPEAVCKAVNLGYRDPASINPDEWKDREDEGYLLVPHAGETLYRLKEGNPKPTPFKVD